MQQQEVWVVEVHDGNGGTDDGGRWHPSEEAARAWLRTREGQHLIYGTHGDDDELDQALADGEGWGGVPPDVTVRKLNQPRR